MIKDYFRHMVFRASKAPLSPMPFGVRSIGHYRLSADASEGRKKKDFLELFWGIAGKGEFIHRNKRFCLGPNRIFLYFPGDHHECRSLGEGWEYRWLTLDGQFNTPVVEAFGLKREIRFAGACPEALFIELERAISDITPAGERRAAALAFQILTLACGRPPETDAGEDLVEKCRDLIEQRFTDPLLSVKGVAAELSVHRSSLCRLFTSRIGVSPHEYLVSLRTRKAMTLLKDTPLSIAQIAEASGYLDPNYFSRALKKMTGMEPRAMRKEFLLVP